jgi:hypothetical protein
MVKWVNNTEINALIEKAAAQGWTVRGGGAKHVQLKSPDGNYLIYASSSSVSRRAVANLRSQLRRAGVNL